MVSPVCAAFYWGEAMNHDELWLYVAQECPRRIIGALHRSGEYHHGTSARFPGKILCCHRDTPLPEGWAPTRAQAIAAQLDQPSTQQHHAACGAPEGAQQRSAG
jgi:hypothetical protein